MVALAEASMTLLDKYRALVANRREMPALGKQIIVSGSELPDETPAAEGEAPKHLAPKHQAPSTEAPSTDICQISYRPYIP